MSLTDMFSTYGDDAETALDAYANYAPAEWSEFVDAAAADTYRRRYAAWMRSQKVHAITVKDQPNLFGEIDAERVTVRARIVGRKDGQRHEYQMTSLAGAEAVEILRAAADRDEAPARSTLINARVMRNLADEIERLSEVEGRPVSVAEVLGIAA